MLGFDLRDLRAILNFLRVNIRDKYLGSNLGSIWSVANPLLMLGIFTFVFGYVYKVKLPGAETTLSYAIWLISGYGPWLAVTESLTASAVSITGASGIIKNMVVKSEVLPISGALTGLLPLVVTMLFLLVMLLVDRNTPTWHVVFLPIVILVQFLLVIAIGFLLAAATVFFRDLAFALPNLLLVVLFASPIFYPIDSMPRIIRGASSYNPFYILSEAYRAVLLYHRIPSLDDLAYVAIASLVLGFFTLKLFRRVKGYFEAAL